MQEMVPGFEVDEFRDDVRRFGELIEGLDAACGIFAGSYYGMGSADVLAFAGGLDAHGGVGESGLKTHLVGDDAFDGGDVECCGAAGESVAIHVETDRYVRRRQVAEAERLIEDQPLQGVDGKLKRRG